MTGERDDRVDRDDEVARVAEGLRRVIAALVGTRAPLEVFDGMAARLEEFAGRLAGYERESLFRSIGPLQPGRGLAEFSPVTGRSHPFAPPVRVTSIGAHVEGLVTFGAAYEGPPGHVHGGFVAAALDELLGMTMAVQHVPGMTGRLTVNYRRPTPLHTELRVIGEVTRVDGRKAYVVGSIIDGDRVCADAEGLFLAIDFGRLKRGEPTSE